MDFEQWDVGGLEERSRKESLLSPPCLRAEEPDSLFPASRQAG